ncbi:DUF1753-domain-containing protein [Tothia fuscella]|uniref:DUF1753-domain-containing protein n=1 Tax=Tothia fuscella TaxID=1048955 RepID=A0A9P4NPC6_9PEZI|nr:DUF1753-domain-containing protein [Tothia fuscella]
MARLLSIPRPTRFLGLISLRTSVTLILFIHLVNKVTGLYGILALLTGFSISPLQLSMYIYSLIVFGVTIHLFPHIQAQSAWHTLAFAQLYALDTIINAAYTVFFSIAWFLVLAAKDDTTSAPGGKTINEASGFTDPKYNVSGVEVIASPKSGLSLGQDAVAVGTGSGPAPQTHGLTTVLTQPSSLMSLFIIILFWSLRIYAVLIVLSYARQTLHHHIQVSSHHNYELYTGSRSSELAENPFEETKEEGRGWRGKVGRFMLSVGKGFWLGREPQDDVWMRGMGSKFRSRGGEEGVGVNERERRRRSGTGPPKPGAGIALGPL